jgi:hypothetical protein
MQLFLESRGLSYGLAIENGWYPSWDAGDTKYRVVIPCTNSRGRVYWQARAVDPNVEKRYQSPKYAAEDSIVVVWPEGEPRRAVVVVEGPLDALAAAECGYPSAAIMGNRPSQAVIQNICRVFPGQEFIVVPDLDSVAAGGFIAGKLALQGRKVIVRVPVGAKDLSRMPALVRSRILAT